MVNGFSLLELLAALAVAVILGSLAVASFTGPVQQSRSTAAINQLIGAVATTRHAAIHRRTTATLCPSANGTDCGPRNTWHTGALIFADADRDGTRSADEPVIAVLPPLPGPGRAYWRSFRNRASLSFGPNGLTLWQSGNFLYCPDTEDARFFRQVILNSAGRARLARDRNGDGIAEDARGRPLTCP
jgi:type IV fimbrial biogenesis protein FimT